jgi:CRISPR-associated protein Csm2
MTPDLNRPPARLIVPDPAKKTIPQSPAPGTTQTRSASGESLILSAIQACETNLADYGVRDMVTHAQAFGTTLATEAKMKTTQVRRFLDAIKRLNTELAKSSEFSTIEVEVLLLKPKVAYTAARHKSAKSFSNVITAAIDKVNDRASFIRLTQLIESIIAYHKAAGGQD